MSANVVYSDNEGKDYSLSEEAFLTWHKSNLQKDNMKKFKK